MKLVSSFTFQFLYFLSFVLLQNLEDGLGWANIILKLGFPIVTSIGGGYFAWKVWQDSSRKLSEKDALIKEMADAHRKDLITIMQGQMESFQKLVDQVRNSTEKNTDAVNALERVIEKWIDK